VSADTTQLGKLFHEYNTLLERINFHRSYCARDFSSLKQSHSVYRQEWTITSDLQNGLVGPFSNFKYNNEHTGAAVHALWSTTTGTSTINGCCIKSILPICQRKENQLWTTEHIAWKYAPRMSLKMFKEM